MRREVKEERFKEEAVRLALGGEQSYAEVARDLGIKYSTLRGWIYKRMEQKKGPTSQETGGTKVSKTDYQAMERALKAAHKELELRKKEIEILKKAAAYFASQK